MADQTLPRATVRWPRPATLQPPDQQAGTELAELVGRVRAQLPAEGRASTRTAITCTCRLERPMGPVVVRPGVLDREGVRLAKPLPFAAGEQLIASVGWGGRQGLAIAVGELVSSAPEPAPYLAFQQVRMGAWELAQALTQCAEVGKEDSATSATLPSGFSKSEGAHTTDGDQAATRAT